MDVLKVFDSHKNMKCGGGSWRPPVCTYLLNILTSAAGFSIYFRTSDLSDPHWETKSDVLPFPVGTLPRRDK